jgi:hypothetical protein
MEKDFQVFEERDIIRVVFTGIFSLTGATQSVDAMVKACAESGLTRVLFDLRPMRGEMPTLDRYDAGAYGGKVVPRGIAVAMLARQNQISPDNFF